MSLKYLNFNRSVISTAFSVMVKRRVRRVKLTVCVNITHICVGYMPIDLILVGIFLGRFFKRAHRNFHSKEEGGGGKRC